MAGTHRDVGSEGWICRSNIRREDRGPWGRLTSEASCIYKLQRERERDVQYIQ